MNHPAKAETNLLNKENPYQQVKIRKVLTADTILLDNLENERVKLIGLKAPAKPRQKNIQKDQYGFVIEDDDPTTSLEETAFNFAKELLEGKYVRLEFDHQKNSDDFDTLAYVFLEDETFVNELLLSLGYAHFKSISPNKKYETRLRAAYQQARQEKRGLQGL